MIAVTSFDGKSSVTSQTACTGPKKALRSIRRIAHVSPAVTSVGGAVSRSVTSSVMSASVSGARDDPRDEADHEHERDEHERTRPRQCVPFVVRTGRVGEDL